KNATVTLKALLSEPIPSVLEAAPDVPPQLATIVSRALEREPDARYPSAGAMRDALEAYLEQIERRSPRRDEIAARMNDIFGAERAQDSAKVHPFMRARAEDRGPPPPPADPSLALAALPRLLPTRPDLESGGSAGPIGMDAPPARPAAPRSGFPNVLAIVS